MNKNPCVIRNFSLYFLTIFFVFVAQTGYADMTPQQVQRVTDALTIHERNVGLLISNPDVVASGIGLDSRGDPVIKVLVTDAGISIPDAVEGVRVHKEVSGRIVALRGPTCDTSGNNICSTTERWPLPVPTGVSVGHPAVTAGTIGARVTDGSNVFILSNNHVIADVNAAILGDNIIQPGSIDGGVNPDDAIAILTDFEPIDFVGTNTIDAAVALSTPGELGNSTPVGQFGSIVGYGTPSSALHPAYGDPVVVGDETLANLIGVAVQKVGRTTGHTMASIGTIGAAVNVCYNPPGCSQTAFFVDQIIINSSNFSAGGDSGSLVVTDDGNNLGVGLLYAGGSTTTILNRIDLVLNRFNVTIDGTPADNLPPVAAFSNNQVPGTLTVDFDGSASTDPDGSIVSYDWDFGDGNVGNGVAPSHTYAAAGTYDVTLIVTDDQSATGDVTQTVMVQPVGGPVCPGAICDNTDTGFATVGAWSTSTGSAGYYGSNYLHDQNAGKGSKTASWTYAISADGNYDVAGHWSAHPNRASSVQYMYSVNGGSPQNCGAPADQRFNGGAFNDLCVAPGLTAGDSLTLSIRNDAAGYVIADAVRVELSTSGNLPPVAAFSANQVFGTLTVDFDGSASSDPDGTIVSYDWDFGDGNIGSGIAPSHTYAAAGTYDVTLTVTDDQSASDDVVQAVTVQPVGGPVCPGTICDNTDTGFVTVGAWSTSTGSSGYFGSNYLHDQNSGKGGKTASWTYAISTDGNYDVAGHWASHPNRASSVQYMYSVNGGSPQNCGAPADQRFNGGAFNDLCVIPALAPGDTLTVSIRNDAAGYVIADAVRVELSTSGNLPPVAAFSANQVFDTLTVDFDASASTDPDGSIVSYDWDFGDGNIGSGIAPSHTYTAAGTYDVTLTVTDDQSAADDVTQAVTVQPVGGAVCPGEICDNTDEGFNTVGTWSASTSSPGFFGGDYLHDQNSGKGSKTASWTYAISADGNYEVAAQWPSWPNRASSVQYMYTVDGGAPQNCGAPQDQRFNGGGLNSLCVIPGLSAGATLTVSIRNDSAGYVIADAVSVSVQ